jgi:hypothetical protein
MARLPEERGITDSDVPCVRYAAKSTKDPRGSIPTQHQHTQAAIELEGDGRFLYGDPQSDQNASAFKGNLGPGLAEAKRLALEAADKHGQAELWVQHSDRIARGAGDAPEAADHLGEVFFWARRSNVRLRSAQDDSNLEDVIRAVLIGERNTEDSRRKSEAVKSGKRRAFERGELPGGLPPQGIEVIREWDERGNLRRTPRLTELIGPIRALGELLDHGYGEPSIARELNRRGLRTADGKPWTRRRVQDSATNPIYYGGVAWRRGKPDEEINWNTSHPAIWTREDYERRMGERAKRDKAKGSKRNPRGRTHSNHALAKLARCTRCGDTMRAMTSTYRRKDGGRRRTYVCRHVHDGTGLCDGPGMIDAEQVDTHVVNSLDRYLGDVEQWREQAVSGYDSQRNRITREVEAGRDDLAKQDRVCARFERLAAEAEDDDEARTALRLAAKAEAERERIKRRLAAAEDALEAIPNEAPVDAMLDFYNELTAAIRGRMEGADTLARINDALRDLFECFYLDTRPEGIFILPVLSKGRIEGPQTVASYAAEGEEITPPLQALRAPSAELANTQESWHSNL